MSYGLRLLMIPIFMIGMGQDILKLKAGQGLTFDTSIRVSVGINPEVVLSWGSLGKDTVGVYRRELGQEGKLTWQWLTDVPSSGKEYKDTDVSLGKNYEYKLWRSNGRSAFVVASLDAPLVEDRGAVLLVVDASKKEELASDLQILEMDLVGDGWRVERLDFMSHFDGGDGAILKREIQDRVNAHPDINSLYLFGALPMVRSGMDAPDGHSPSRAHETDCFYADLDGSWTDVSLNIPGNNTDETSNVPGDGKYDQSRLPSRLELATGRVTFHKMTNFKKSETEYLRDYIHKSYAWKHSMRKVPYRARLSDTNNGYYLFTARNWLTPMLGGTSSGNMSFGGLQPETSGNAYLWAYTTGTPGTENNAMQGIFCANFKSWKQHFWRANNPIRSILTQPDWGLTGVWGARPPWYFHHMAAGETVGYSATRTQNNYFNGNEYEPFDYSYMSNNTTLNLMGDPTLRMHPLESPRLLSLTKVTGGLELTWMASLEGRETNYSVYRSIDRLGPYQRIFTGASTALSYVDKNVPAGSVYYQVRAIAKMELPTGRYWNQSQGIFAHRDAQGVLQRAPIAKNIDIFIPKDTKTKLDLVGQDPDGDALECIVIKNPARGWLRWENGNIFYEPEVGMEGEEEVVFCWSDGLLKSEPAHLRLFVNSSVQVNEPPVASPLAYTLRSGHSVTLNLIGNDPEGTPLTYELVDLPLHGSLSGSLPEMVYIADVNFNGVDVLRYRVSDGQNVSNVADVTLEVLPNRAPEIQKMEAISPFLEGDAMNTQLVVEAVDADGDQLTYFWRYMSGPKTVVMSGVTMPQLNVQLGGRNDQNGPGTYRFEVEISDGFTKTINSIEVIWEPETPVNTDEYELWGEDDFNDNQLTTIDPTLVNGMSWTTVQGGAYDQNVLIVGRHASTSSMVVSDQILPRGAFKVEVLIDQAYVVGSSHQGIVFLYRDPDNYYVLVVNREICALYRYYNGVKTLIGSTGYLSLQHQRSNAKYRVEVQPEIEGIKVDVQRSDWAPSPEPLSTIFTDYSIEAKSALVASRIGFVQPTLNTWNISRYDDLKVYIKSQAQGPQLWGSDDFSDGNIYEVDASLQQGLSWVKEIGAIGTVEGEMIVGRHVDGPSIVLSAVLPSSKFNIEFDNHQGYIVGSRKPGLLMFYQDRDNHYRLVMNRDKVMLIRMHQGVETILGTSTALKMGHAWSRAHFSVEVSRDANGIMFQVVRSDWTANPEPATANFKDTDLNMMNIFNSGAIGFIEPDSLQWNVARYDNVIITINP